LTFIELYKSKDYLIIKEIVSQATKINPLGE